MISTNGYHTTAPTVPTIPVIPVEPMPGLADLDAWEDAIAELDAAMRDAADARLSIDRLHRKLEALEAGHILTIEGGNAEQRKARLTLALNDDAGHLRTVQAIDACRARLLEAERRVHVGTERCRLLRAALALRAER
jgi:uncharacterized membrane protein YdfJ with MMPL/SSD domain